MTSSSQAGAGPARPGFGPGVCGRRELGADGAELAVRIAGGEVAPRVSGGTVSQTDSSPGAGGGAAHPPLARRQTVTLTRFG